MTEEAGKRAIEKALLYSNKEIMTKVIFLDIDGVLNSNFWNADHQREISDGKYIDTEKVKLLSELVKKSGALLRP